MLRGDDGFIGDPPQRCCTYLTASSTGNGRVALPERK